MGKNKIVLAYSGGLDTSYCIKYLEEKDYEVYAVYVDTSGDFDTKKFKQFGKRALELGAATFEKLIALDSFYNQIIRFLIYGNILKNNTYPLSVSAERVIQADQIVAYAKKIGAKYIAHGCTGAGNDQIRFDTIFNILAPEIKIIAPIRTNNLTRKEEIAYLKKRGVHLNWEKAQYSVNRGLWGTTIGGSETLTSNQPLPPSAYPSIPIKTDSLNLKIDFHKGELRAIDGQEDHPTKLIQQINRVCNQYAIGRDIHVGDTIIGIKGRVGFEAGGPLLLIKAHHLLEKHTLSKWQQFQKEQLAQFYGMLLHEGNYWDPVMRDIEAFLSQSQKAVSGTIFCTLFPQRFELLGVESPSDLMQHSLGNYGEQNTGWEAKDVEGFIKISSLSNKIFHEIHKKK